VGYYAFLKRGITVIIRLPKITKTTVKKAIMGLLCIALNVVLCYITTSHEWPFYFDTIGTMVMAFSIGYLPAITVAVLTSLMCSIFSRDALFFALIGVFVALRCDSQAQNKKSGAGQLICLIADLAIITGGLGAVLQWLIMGQPQYQTVSDTATLMAGDNKILFFISSVILVMGFNFVEKGVSVLMALFISNIIPKKTRQRLRDSMWMQAPLSKADIREIRKKSSRSGQSLRTKVLFIMLSVVIPLTIIIGIVSARINYAYIKDDGKNLVVDVSTYVASSLDPQYFDRFLKDGERLSEYGNMKYLEYNRRIMKVKESFPQLEYLYVYQIREDGCYVIFDTDAEAQETGYVGERVDFDEGFLPLVPDLLEGKEIDVMEIKSRYGYFITSYKPIYDGEGKPTNYYVGADILLDNYSDYVREFIIRLALASSGFFAMIVAYGLSMAANHLVYPMGSLEKSIDGFMRGIEDQDKLDDSVKELERLDIRTDDELEKLYRSVCEMANQTAEQMRSIRMLARSNEKMQSGLIVTMADLFENQNIDSRAHIQKVTEYVRIILEGLRRKGYYPEKLTDKFMNDVEMSAPLYDIGKVSIPGHILNKPGELDEQERELIKTHTTAGKKILENAITTVAGENYMKEARNMAAYHHENWDGTGYPVGLHGEVIPLSARVMAIADAFDELTSPRAYKEAISPQEALDVILQGSGSEYDPKCVEAFADAFTEVKGVIRKYPE
jgi:response regulator RpfG family c-di-GMP phosphodiesterase